MYYQNFLKNFCPVEILFLRSELPEDTAGCYRQMEQLSLSKTPAGILVDRSLL